MASKNYVELTFAGDAKKLKTATDVGSKAVKDFSQDVEKSSDKAAKALGTVDEAGQQIKPVDAKVSVSGDGESVAKISAVEKAGKSIKDADAKVSVSGDSEARSKLADVDKAGQNIKPVKVPVEVESDKIGKISDKFKDVGKESAGNFVSALSGGILAGGIGDIIGSAMEKASANAHIKIDLQNQMGISEQEASGYGRRVGNMFAQGVGDSKEQISSAFSFLSSDVKNWGKLTTSAQDDIAHNAVKVSTAFHTDIEEPIRAASSMVSNGLSPSFTAAFDAITFGYQNLGSRASDAMDTLTEYSGYFKALGIDAPQALGLIQQGLQAGARDTDYIADAFKELGIRAIDGSKGVSDALKEMGLNAKKIPEQIAAGGPQAEQAVEQIIKKLQGIKDPIQRNRDGVALFGTQWEDTMKNIIGSIDPVQAKMADLGGSTEKLSDTAVTQADKFERRWDKFMGGLGEGLSASANAMIDFGAALVDNPLDAVSGQVDNFGNSMNGLSIGVQSAANVSNAYSVEVLKMAQAADGNGTPAMRSLLNAMSDSELKAYGAKRGVDAAKQSVIELPGGKTIVVTADDKASGVITNIAGRSYTAVVKLTGVWAGYSALPNGVVLSGSSAHGNASGGWINGPGSETSDDIPRMLSNNEFVVKATEAKKYGAVLESINAGMGVPTSALPGPPSLGGAGGGYGGGGGNVSVNLVISSDGRESSDYELQRLRSMVRLNGGGNVQLAFGGRS